MDAPNFTRIAALIGDNARAEVLSALMADRARTATELADIAGVTKQTISSHLAKLVDAGLIAVVKQGRHRYFRLAGPDIAQFLESLMGLACRSEPVYARTGPRDPSLRKARVCYDHLAGELGVLAYEGLMRLNVIQQAAGGLILTAGGRDWFRRIGIDARSVATEKRTFCRACLDWSERRDHLAGALGTALFLRIQELGWAEQAADSRVVTFSPAGEQAFRALFEVAQVDPCRAQPGTGTDGL